MSGEGDAMACHIIAVPADILKKRSAAGTRTGGEFSLAAVKWFPGRCVSSGSHLGGWQKPANHESGKGSNVG
jgi:hypothetical protein